MFKWEFHPFSVLRLVGAPPPGGGAFKDFKDSEGTHQQRGLRHPSS